jgi:hypothetical protein
MPDVFISYSAQDEHTAKQVQRYFQANHVSAFLAPFSIQPGKKWSPAILSSLRQSRVVLVLASRAACASPFVNQEFGGSLALNKRIVPVVWDMRPEELPGWMKEFQAVDLSKGLNDLRPVLDSITVNLKLDKQREGFFVVAGVVLLIFLLASSEG